MKKTKALLKIKVECALEVAEVQKLPPVDQAEAAYDLLGHVTDRLADFGFDPSVVACAAGDLAHELIKLAGGPVQVVRTDPRKKR